MRIDQATDAAGKDSTTHMQRPSMMALEATEARAFSLGVAACAAHAHEAVRPVAQVRMTGKDVALAGRRTIPTQGAAP